MRQKTYIIGKRSNLSRALSLVCENATLVSSQDIKSGLFSDMVKTDSKFNIILNNFRQSSAIANFNNSIEFIDESVVVTARILEAIKEKQVKKLIYTSSSAVYGPQEICIESSNGNPVSLHAALKYCNEKLIETFCRKNNIDYTITRLFNLYGGNDSFSMIQKIINSVKTGSALTLFNHGSAKRDYIHIDDVAYIYSKILNAKNLPLINVGTGKGESIREILDSIQRENIHIKVNNLIRDELSVSIADTKLLFTILGSYSFKDVKNFVEVNCNA